MSAEHQCDLCLHMPCEVSCALLDASVTLLMSQLATAELPGMFV